MSAPARCSSIRPPAGEGGAGGQGSRVGRRIRRKTVTKRFDKTSWVIEEGTSEETRNKTPDAKAQAALTGRGRPGC